MGEYKIHPHSGLFQKQSSNKRARPRGRAPGAFKDSMVRGVLRVALRFACRCVLHRCENQDIHCRESYVFVWGGNEDEMKEDW